MTNDEAIKILKVAVSEVEWNYPLDYAIAIETAIEVLEKQIPQKVISDSRKLRAPRVTRFAWFRCPNCEYDISDERKDEFDFCHNCGQALDWKGAEFSP